MVAVAVVIAAAVVLDLLMDGAMLCRLGGWVHVRVRIRRVAGGVSVTHMQN